MRSYMAAHVNVLNARSIENSAYPEILFVHFKLELVAGPEPPQKVPDRGRQVAELTQTTMLLTLDVPK